MKRILCLACVVVICAVSRANVNAQQTTPTPSPASTGVEVTSIKPSSPGAAGPFGAIPAVVPLGDGRYTASNIPLRLLVRMAYGLYDFQVVDGPAWLTSSRFDITAKAPDSIATMSTTELQPLVKALLAERFKLKAHTETRDLPAYGLVVAKSDGTLGSSMKPSSSECKDAEAENRKRVEAIAKGGVGALASMLPKPGETVKCAMMPALDPTNPAAGFGLRADGQPLSQLTLMLTMITGRPVSDQTGLKGLYDWELKFDPRVFLALLPQMGLNVLSLGGNTTPADQASLLTALQEQLGLRLDAQRGPMEVLVIDSIEMPQP